MATEVNDAKALSGPSTNTAGIIGFVLSLLGPLSPIGLIVSLFALRRQPRGFAIAGAIIGGLSTLGVAAFFAVSAVWLSMRSPESSEPPMMRNQAALQEAQQRIEEYRGANAALPDAAAGNQLIGGIRDAWDRQLRYDSSPVADAFVVRSAGADGEFDTEDDATTEQASIPLNTDELELDIDFGQ